MIRPAIARDNLGCYTRWTLRYWTLRLVGRS